MNSIFIKRFPFLQTALPFKKLSYAGISSEYFAMDKIKELKKDVLLYTFEKTNLFRYMSFFGVAQSGICTFLGLNIMTSLKDTGHNTVSDENSEKWSWRNINFGATNYKIIAGLSCISVGFITAYITYVLPTRIVKQLTLCKGGQMAWIVTHGPFGRTKQLKIPLQQMSCMITRGEAKSYIPLKVKNKWFFYLMDCKGQFLQPHLFDLTVGARSWRY